MSQLPALKGALDKVDTLLQGEPARAIGYGAALVVVGVIAVSNALGFTRLGENIDVGTALGLTVTAIGFVSGVVEGIRKFVFAPATVDVLVEDAVLFGIDGRDST